MLVICYQWLILILAFLLSIFGLLYTRSILLSTYMLLWSIFHASEYLVTFYCLPRTLTPYSFLIYGARGSVQLAGFHLASIVEHMVTIRYWTNHSSKLGVPLAILGIMVRVVAIATCGNSFSHYIETRARLNSGEVQNLLVTHGIYSWCRHPSYMGFLVYVVGMQVVLGNFVLLLVSVVVLGRFFVRRMDVEEWILVHELYGDEYVEYQKRVKRMIPGVY